MNEKVIEMKLRDKVKKLGGIALKIWCVTLSGFPDRIVLMPGGKVLFVELKTTGRKPTKLQLHVHELLRRLNFSVWIIDSEFLLQKFLNEIQK